MKKLPIKAQSALDDLFTEFGELSRAAKGFTERLEDFSGEITPEIVKSWKEQIQQNVSSTLFYLKIHLENLEEAVKQSR